MKASRAAIAQKNEMQAIKDELEAQGKKLDKILALLTKPPKPPVDKSKAKEA